MFWAKETSTSLCVESTAAAVVTTAVGVACFMAGIDPLLLELPQAATVRDRKTAPVVLAKRT